MKKILVVEDDAAIRQGLSDALSFSSYTPLEASDAKSGLDMAMKRDYDLLILDLVLPGGDGFEILKSVRVARPTLPVIILSARGEEMDRIKGLKLGADDYVVKPFSIKELLARIEAVLRRTPQRPTDVRFINIPDGKIDLSRREIIFNNGDRVELSEKECLILRYLAMNSGRALSREELLRNVWRISPSGIMETRTIDMHVARLREKLKDTQPDPGIIITVRGEGYMFGQGEKTNEK